MTLGKAMLVEQVVERAGRVVWNDGECPLGGDGLTKMISVIGCVGP